ELLQLANHPAALRQGRVRRRLRHRAGDVPSRRAADAAQGQGRRREGGSLTHGTCCELLQKVSPQTACLFDHLVGGGGEGPWHVQAKRLGGLHIDDELVLGRCLNWKVAWLLALEDAVNVACCAYVGINGRWPVGEETAALGEIAERIDRR